MNQAAILDRRNRQPSRGLALAGAIFFVKAILLLPHAIIVGVLGWLAGIVAYVGFWIVAFTGRMPEGIATILDIYLRWTARTAGWFTGIVDEYPPFETDPTGYGFDATLPHNEAPSRGLAVAGILFFVKAILLIPHMIVLWFVYIGAIVATWVGFVIAAFTGRLPEGIQDFVAGTLQWWTRVVAWLYGLTDEYPPFSLQISPAD
jgi:hypothetical protein